MGKNIIVADKDGNEIGHTYPKRARGLVKNGRAEYVSDCEIRLLNSVDYSAPMNTEEDKMSNIINFNPREFKFDETCKDNTGMRAFITTDQGNAEVYEIGDWCWSWTQICCEKKLEKNTDYVFRFAMTGGYNDEQSEVSLAEIYALDGYEDSTAAWENRMTFALAKSRFRPVISKRDRTGLLRVFEIPFNTGNSENWRFVLVAQRNVSAFFAPLELSAYDGLEDLTYDQWWEERQSYLSNNYNNKTIISTGSNDGDGCTHMDNMNFSEQSFARCLCSLSDEQVTAFSNITVSSDGSEEIYCIGDRIDGAVLSFENITITSKAFSMIMKKVGDGCVINMENVTVTDEGDLYDVSEDWRSDETVIRISSTTLPQRAADMIYEKRGDECVIDMSSCEIV